MIPKRKLLFKANRETIFTPIKIPNNGIKKCIIPTIIEKRKHFFDDKFVVPMPKDKEKVSILKAMAMVIKVISSFIKNTLIHFIRGFEKNYRYLLNSSSIKLVYSTLLKFDSLLSIIHKGG